MHWTVQTFNTLILNFKSHRNIYLYRPWTKSNDQNVISKMNISPYSLLMTQPLPIFIQMGHEGRCVICSNNNVKGSSDSGYITIYLKNKTIFRQCAASIYDFVCVSVFQKIIKKNSTLVKTTPYQPADNQRCNVC